MHSLEEISSYSFSQYILYLQLYSHQPPTFQILCISKVVRLSETTGGRSNRVTGEVYKAMQCHTKVKKNEIFPLFEHYAQWLLVVHSIQP